MGWLGKLLSLLLSLFDEGMKEAGRREERERQRAATVRSERTVEDIKRQTADVPDDELQKEIDQWTRR